MAALVTHLDTKEKSWNIFVSSKLLEISSNIVFYPEGDNDISRFRLPDIYIYIYIDSEPLKICPLNPKIQDMNLD